MLIIMSTMSSLNISISIRKKLMLMLMSQLSSLAHKLLMLMFMLMLVSLVRAGLKNAMRVYTAELICSPGVLGFQTFKPVFCIYNKLHLPVHSEMLS